MIRFTVYGEPVAQGRPRAANIGGHIRMYDPKKSRDYKDYVKLAASEFAPKELLNGPIILSVNVFRPMPKSLSKKRAALAEQGLLRPTTRPDADNYIKGIKDALKNVIWKDDSQIVELHTSKFYSARPRVEIMVQEWHPPDAQQAREKVAQAAFF